jgi:RHS repeat-associated protein
VTLGGSRDDESGRGDEEVVVSARPDKLDETADGWDQLNGDGGDGFNNKLTKLSNAYNTFTTSNGWGAVDASKLVQNVGTWVSANGADANFTRAVAAAFRAADAPGGDGVSFSTNDQILSLVAAMIPGDQSSWSDFNRANIDVASSTAYGGQTTTGFAIDPVSTASGNFFEVEVDLAFGPTLRNLQLRRAYNSLGSFVGPFGPGWSSWASTRMKLSASGTWARLRGPDGQVAEIPMPEGTVAGFEARVEVVGEAAVRLAAGAALSPDGFPVEGRSADRHDVGAGGVDGRAAGNGEAGVTPPNGQLNGHVDGGRRGSPGGAPVLVARFEQERMTWSFDAEGRPVVVEAGPGTRLRLSWDGERLVGMAHERGRSVRLEWEGERIVAAVADDGRRVSYRYDDLGRLVQVEAPSGDRRYEWNDQDRIAAVTDADGVVAARNVYDDAGRVTAQDTPAGRRVRFWYRPGLVTEVDDESGGPTNVWVHDENARLVKVIDGHGEATSKVYDDEGRVIRVKDRRGAVTSMEWDSPTGGPTRVEHPNGTVVEISYDHVGRVLSATGPEGGTARFSYAGDDDRHPSEIVDPEGGVTRLRVEADLVKEIVDPDGVTARFDHDAEGRLVAVTDGAGATTRMEYHPTGQLAAITTPLGSRTELERDAAGRLLARHDPDGAVTRIERSPAGRVTAVVAPSGARQEYHHGRDGEVEQAIDPSGAATSVQRDEHGSIVSAMLPDGGKWTFDHDALLRVVGVTDPSGSTWLREHDVDGALVGTIGPTGVQRSVQVDPTGMIQGVDDGLAKIGFEYDAAGRATAQVRADGSRSEVVYDACGRVVSVTEPGGGTSHVEYTPAGRLAALVGPTGARTTYAYDAAGRLRETTLPTGGRQRIRYDAANRIVRVTGPTGETTRYEYDPVGRVVAATAPNGGVTRYDHDAGGRLVAVTGPDGAVTRHTYDIAGSLTAVVDPNGGETRYEYDVMGRIVGRTDPLGARHEQTLDPMGRPVETVDPLGRRTSYTYDQAGRVVGRVDPDGARHWWRWDDADQLAAQGDDESETRYHRDLLGRATEIVRDGHVAVRRRWDEDGNLVEERTGTHTLSWAYDAAANVVATTLAVQGFAPVTTRYERNASGRIVAVDDPTLGRIHIERDLSGRPVRIAGQGMRERRTYTDGRLASWSREIDGRPTQSVRYTRDQTGRVISEQHGDGRAVHHAYDLAGQLVGIDDAGSERRWRFTYDAAGRLVEETTPAGVRTFTYDAASQLQAVRSPDGETTYEWDASGRRVGQSGPAGTRRYRWNAHGQLDRITTRPTDGSEARRDLTHDALGRLARVDDTPLTWDAGRLARVGGQRLIGAGTTTWGLAGLQADAPASWLPTNARGEAAGLDPWGTSSDATVPDGSLPLPAGLGLGHRGELDLGGLTWLRARAYDPATRGFLSPDPLPGVAGTPWGNNTYSYAGNDPVGHADPLGLRPVSDAELASVRETWDDNAFQRYEGYIVAGVLAVAAVALVCTGVGGVLGAALMGMAISGAMSAASQQYFTGGLDYGQLGMDMAIGAFGGGAGAMTSVATQGLRTGARIAVTQGVDMAVNVGGGMATAAYNGQDPFDPQNLAVDALTGGIPSGGAARNVDVPTPADLARTLNARNTGSSVPVHNVVSSTTGGGGGGSGMTIYRTAREGADGMPELGASARTLGARPGTDVHPDADGNVHPLGTDGRPHGMSAAGSVEGTPDFRRGPEYGGTARPNQADPVWSMNTNDLPEGLSYHPDNPNALGGHGVVAPNRTMPFDDYQARIQSTQGSWTKVPPTNPS